MKYLFILLFCFGCMTPKKVSEIVKAELAKQNNILGWGGITYQIYPNYKWDGKPVENLIWVDTGRFVYPDTSFAYSYKLDTSKTFDTSKIFMRLDSCLYKRTK